MLLDDLVVQVEFPDALEEEDEGHPGEDQREDDQDHQDVLLLHQGVRRVLGMESYCRVYEGEEISKYGGRINVSRFM